MRRRDSGAIQLDLDYHAERRAEMAERRAASEEADLALFNPAEAASPGGGDNSPVEHAEHPKPKVREEVPPTVVFSLETEADRAALAELLGGTFRKGAAGWEGTWPPGAEDGAALRLDLGDGE
jgi:hypothetical protein